VRAGSYVCVCVCCVRDVLSAICRVAPPPTYMVGPDLQRLVLPHQQPHFFVLLVLQQPDDAQSALLPLVAGPVIPVQLALAVKSRKSNISRYIQELLEAHGGVGLSLSSHFQGCQRLPESVQCSTHAGCSHSQTHSSNRASSSSSPVLVSTSSS